MDRSVLARKPMTELKDIASHLNMRGYQKLRKAELIDAIISSGTDAGDGGDGGQQRLVSDDQPSGQPSSDGQQAGETAEARDRRVAREESARKVLPPGARQDGGSADSGSTDNGSAGGESDGADGPRDPEGSEGQSSQRTRGDRPQRGTRSQEATGRDARDGGQDGGRDDGDARGGTRGAGRNGSQDDQRGGGPRGSQRGQQRDSQQDEAARGSAAHDSSRDADDDYDDDDDSAAGRKRRNRRDRRKRNRDRQGAEETPTPTAPPSGNDPGEVRAGVLDILPEGYGFLRTTGYLPGERDVYVSQGQIRKHLLRRGDVVQGPIRQQRSNEKVPALHHVQRVNGDELEDGQVGDRPDFDELTPIASDERLLLATGDGQSNTTARLVDLIAPLGRGQRALVVAPPRSGKSAVLRDLAQALADASPDSHLMAVLVDERPEEITEMAAVIPGEVIASTFDRAAEDHTQIAELAIERARRLVELGHDVIVLLDSVTRLARAYGVTAQSTGRTIAPGVEATSLYGAKRFLAAARNTEEGGSLTVIATGLSDTGSGHDAVILEEVVRVANTVVHLDATLARRRVHPPIAVLESGTDNESALQDQDELAIVHSMRRALEGMAGDAAAELVLDAMARTTTTDDLLTQIRDARP